jgi:hypothetical protein
MDWRKHHAIRGLCRDKVRLGRIALLHDVYAPGDGVAEMQRHCCECETSIRHNCHDANERSQAMAIEALLHGRHPR